MFLSVSHSNLPPISNSQDPVTETLLSRPHLTYLLRGHRLTHNAIDIRLYQLLLPSVSPKEPPQLLDPLDTYILQAALKVQDGQSLERMQEGVDQLMGLKETLKGCVALEAAERLSFDTRVKLGS